MPSGPPSRLTRLKHVALGLLALIAATAIWLPTGAAQAGWPVVAGVAYALFYFVVVLVVPILFLAAAIFAGLLLWMRRRTAVA